MSLAQLMNGVPHIESPLFPSFVESLGLSDYERIVADQLFERGYAVVDFPDPDIHARIARIRERLTPVFGLASDDPAEARKLGGKRVQDAWRDDADVRAIACNPEILRLLGKFYGRTAYPFQTLNFPVGTQQHMHSDSVHFSSVPERFMCGVWLAFEDIGPDSGPLHYYPGTHKWSILTNEKLNLRVDDVPKGKAQSPYEAVWRALVEQEGIKPEPFLARKGQAVIWAANLLHGGQKRLNKALTRWSQVTHYYFENCIYYTPAYSQPSIGRLDVRHMTNIQTGEPVENMFMGEAIEDEALGGERLGSVARVASKLRAYFQVSGDKSGD